ncbi:MAG: FAD-dependent oxidoreductase [Absicoccus sp.]|nr:FAD-dependent oxidoreductase [Absicoccus sp.]MDY3036166.1 FAD-dependent oxidoreductase [Absicoccus sp.]
MATVLIIGGGPAGMMAAYAAQKNHHTVHLFEKNEQLGKNSYALDMDDAT